MLCSFESVEELGENEDEVEKLLQPRLLAQQQQEGEHERERLAWELVENVCNLRSRERVGEREVAQVIENKFEQEGKFA